MPAPSIDGSETSSIVATTKNQSSPIKNNNKPAKTSIMNNDTEEVDLIRSLKGWHGLTFNPRTLVKIINRLSDRGRDRAAQILKDYISNINSEHGGKPENALLVARLLFVTNDGSTPPQLRVGRPDVQEPRDSNVFPMFPLALYDDIPFLLVSGYYLGGQPQPPAKYIEWCIQSCHARAPLLPADDPLLSVDELLESDAFRALELEPWHRQMLRLQALRAVSRIYPVNEEEAGEILATPVTDKSEESWRRHKRNFQALRPSWNPEIDDYESRRP